MVVKQQTKVTIRRLPPDLTEAELKEILGQLTPHDYFKFHKADASLAPAHTTRAYIKFVSFEDVLEFRDNFDGRIFEDKRGHKYMAQIELAISSLIPRGKQREDRHCGTVENDEDFKEFKEAYEAEKPEVQQINIEEYLKEAAAKEEERKKPMTTPLIDFVRAKKKTKRRDRDEKRKEERKKRRDDERRNKQKDKRERNDRKKNLIEGKTEDDKATSKRQQRNSESRLDGNIDDERPKESASGPKGGRTAAREKRKREFEEKRKARISKQKENAQSAGDTGQASDVKSAESKPASSKPSRGEGQSRRYSRRKDTARGNTGAKAENS